MPDESPALKQGDIEDLLRQAQMASGLTPESPAMPDAVAPQAALPPDQAAAVSISSEAATASINSPRAAFTPLATAGQSIGDDVQFLLAQAQQAIASVENPSEPNLASLAPFELKDLAGAPATGEKATLELLKDVDLDLRIELGRTHMYLEDVLKLKRGSVVTLDKLAGDPVDVFVNGRIVARGEVLVLNDNFCIRVTELLTGDDFGYSDFARMRIFKAPRWALLIAVALAPALVFAQQPGSLISPQFTPLTVDQPQTLPTGAARDARPLNPSFSSAPRPPQPPVNVRLMSGEEPISNSKAKPPLRLAPRSEFNRQHGQKPSAPTPSGALTTVGGSLALVLGLFLVIAWCAKRFSPAGATVLPKEAVEILGRAPLATRQQAHLVRIGNKLLLVAISPTGAETLTEITEPTEVEHLTALCRRGKPASSTLAFRQALTELANEPAPAGFVGASRSSPRGAR